MESKLRDYQEKAVTQAEEALNEHGSTLLVMPTGTGKTQVFVSIGDRQQYGRVLVLAHRDELINQARDRITQMVGERPDVEKAEQRADRNLWWRTKCVV